MRKVSALALLGNIKAYTDKVQFVVLGRELVCFKS